VRFLLARWHPFPPPHRRSIHVARFHQEIQHAGFPITVENRDDLLNLGEWK